MPANLFLASSAIGKERNCICFMKKICCELCGSNDFVKDGGMFVCQSCGTKYTLEEAKKLMIEGTVEVTGTVTVDNRER